ncbi:glutaredoxin family protein [Cytobacillus firmus]|uniref:glutaredoxin family protein n=1 Tax=Cytobacillus firmus TaxID=1399 RepID=UPI0015809BDC|nr:glutaredoxin family protein [Cytobacillus firmus]MBG9545937.1 glutaredoxin [Cytobacillus firmus]MBG9604005.1 glutaredoxin [Cytobacillus firmus]MBG9654209.1 glutaredoxin [Cytobacillus firmus]MDD9312996.1 glutaredoxin family protein [Cytobacillus firmus]MED1907022.1 glutaredoxin family protein [Cytobacillus firmus]
MKEIVLYTQPDCPPCEITKMFLNENGYAYTIKDIKKDAAAHKELTRKYKSFSTPTVVIGDTVIRGFDLEKLRSAIGVK